MGDLDTFEGYRDYLFAIAYRMLGRVNDAEDVLQDAYLRWKRVDAEQVESPKSYLASIVTRLSIDQLKSARARREQYIGPWLPEPLITGRASDPAHVMALADSLKMAFLVLLENLTPEQRAIYLLREVFDYEYGEIAAMMEKTEAACRQQVSRARRALRAVPEHANVEPEARQRVVERFISAATEGDLPELMEVLDANVVWTSDGGGTPGVARRPIRGVKSVARFVKMLSQRALPGTEAHMLTINGEPGVLITRDGRPFVTLAIELEGIRIRSIWAVANPDKLAHLGSGLN